MGGLVHGDDVVTAGAGTTAATATGRGYRGYIDADSIGIAASGENKSTSGSDGVLHGKGFRAQRKGHCSGDRNGLCRIAIFQQCNRLPALHRFDSSRQGIKIGGLAVCGNRGNIDLFGIFGFCNELIDRIPVCVLLCDDHHLTLT